LIGTEPYFKKAGNTAQNPATAWHCPGRKSKVYLARRQYARPKV